MVPPPPPKGTLEGVSGANPSFLELRNLQNKAKNYVTRISSLLASNECLISGYYTYYGNNGYGNSGYNRNNYNYNNGYYHNYYSQQQPDLFSSLFGSSSGSYRPGVNGYDG